MKYFRAAIFFFSVVLLQCSIFAQPPVASPLPSLSEKLTHSLNRTLKDGGPDSARRTAALTDLLKAQRQLLTAGRQQTLVENIELRNAAKTTLIAALDKDPTLAEAYTMLAEIEITSEQQNIPKALALTDLAIRSNPVNFGSLRLRARIQTRLSRLGQESVDRDLCLKVISSWKQVIKLDPVNAEGWAFLSSLYEFTGDNDLQLEALQKWAASTAPLETGFYRAVMGREAELTPESASIELAAALIKRSRAEEAIEILTRILIDDPENKKAAKLAADTIDNEPAPAIGRIAKKLRSALSSNPGNEALILLVEKISPSRM